MPPLANARLVVIRNVERLRDDGLEALTAALGKVPPGARVVLTATALDLRKGAQSRLAKAASLERVEVGGGRDAGAARREILALIGQLCAERRIRLDREAADTLVDLVKGDAGRIASELDKIALRFGEEPVDAEQVKDSFAGERPLSAFGLATAIRERKIAQAIGEMRRSLAANQPLEVLLGQIAGEVRALLRARSLLDGGLSEEAAKRAFGGGRGYFVVPQAKRYRATELMHALEELGQIDLAAKTGGGDATVLLEKWLIDLRAPRSTDARRPAAGRAPRAPR